MSAHNSEKRRSAPFILSFAAHLLFVGLMLTSPVHEKASTPSRLGVVELREVPARAIVPKKTAHAAKKAVTPPRPANEIQSQALLQQTDETQESSEASNPNGSGESQMSYESEIRREIELHKKYPRVAQARRQQGRVEIQLNIAKTGEYSGVKIAKASGYTVLDEAAYKAVTDVEKFSPFPEGLRKSSIDVIVPIDFIL